MYGNESYENEVLQGRLCSNRGIEIQSMSMGKSYSSGSQGKAGGMGEIRNISNVPLG